MTDEDSFLNAFSSSSSPCSAPASSSTPGPSGPVEPEDFLCLRASFLDLGSSSVTLAKVDDEPMLVLGLAVDTDDADALILFVMKYCDRTKFHSIYSEKRT